MSVGKEEMGLNISLDVNKLEQVKELVHLGSQKAKLRKTQRAIRILKDALDWRHQL